MVRLLHTVLLLLAISGVVWTGLLTQETHRLALNDAPGQSQICGVLGGDCTGALTSPDARVLNVPLSYWGLGWYSGMLAFLSVGFVFLPITGHLKPLAHPGYRSLLFITVVGGIVSATAGAYYLGKFFAVDWTTLEIAQRGDYPVCPLCVATHLTSIPFFLVACLAWAWFSLKARKDANRRPPRPEIQHAFLFSLGLAVLLGVLTGTSAILGAQHIESTQRYEQLQTTYNELRSRPEVRRILMNDGAIIVEPGEPDEPESDGAPPLAAEPSPAALDESTTQTANAQQPTPPVARRSSEFYRGSKNAPALLTMLFDFQCPHCARHHFELTSLLEEVGGENLQIQYEHYPLDTSCNKYAAAQTHKNACAAHLAALAAHQQGKFWEYADIAFRSQNVFGRDPWVGMAREIGLDVDQFERDFAAPETAELLQNEIEKSRRWGVRGTPRFIVGKRVLPGHATAEDAVMTALDESGS